jgi:hypothetical protein
VGQLVTVVWVVAMENTVWVVVTVGLAVDWTVVVVVPERAGVTVLHHVSSRNS